LTQGWAGGRPDGRTTTTIALLLLLLLLLLLQRTEKAKRHIPGLHDEETQKPGELTVLFGVII
jgi:hypothetical protein